MVSEAVQRWQALLERARRSGRKEDMDAACRAQVDAENQMQAGRTPPASVQLVAEANMAPKKDKQEGMPEAPNEKKPRAKGKDLVKVRAEAVGTALVKLANVRTKDVLSDKEYDDTFAAITKAVAWAKSEMDAKRNPKAPDLANPLKLSY